MHLMREGLDRYVSEFNTMVREVMGVTGNIGIEVLPFVPVIIDGIDEVGRELLFNGLQVWVGGKRSLAWPNGREGTGRGSGGLNVDLEADYHAPACKVGRLECSESKRKHTHSVGERNANCNHKKRKEDTLVPFPPTQSTDITTSLIITYISHRP